MIMYGLRHKETQRLVACLMWTSRYEENVQYLLDAHEFVQPWLVRDKAIADRAMMAKHLQSNPVNNNYETPENDYIGQLEVVKVEIVISLA